MRRVVGSTSLDLLSALIPSFLAALLTAAAADADWLVTYDGGLVETRGEWRVEGRRVLFTLPNGTLSAIRVSEVDLDASRAATEFAKRSPQVEDEAVETPKPEPVLVLTNKDIPQAVDDATSEGEAAGGRSPSDPGLRVIDWSAEPGDGGLRIVGRLENGTDRSHSGVGLRVEVRNEDGEVLATSTAMVTRETLIAGGITSFEARFPGYSELPGRPAFVIDSRETRQPQGGEDAARDAVDAGEESVDDPADDMP